MTVKYWKEYLIIFLGFSAIFRMTEAEALFGAAPPGALCGVINEGEGMGWRQQHGDVWGGDGPLNIAGLSPTGILPVSGLPTPDWRHTTWGKAGYKLYLLFLHLHPHLLCCLSGCASHPQTIHVHYTQPLVHVYPNSPISEPLSSLTITNSYRNHSVVSWIPIPTTPKGNN